MKKVLLVDGSSILSTCFFGNTPKEYLEAKTDEEFEACLDKLLKTSDGVFVNGIYPFCKLLEKIQAESYFSHIAVAWDKGRNTFRKKMYEGYKAQRKTTRAELSSQFVKMQQLLEYIGIPTLLQEEYEADDLIGSMAQKYAAEADEIVIWTKDQDALQLINNKVSVWLVTSKAEEIKTELGLRASDMPFLNKTFCFTEERFKKHYGFEPIQMIDFKSMVGDKSDNIPGIQGIGETGAKALLYKFKTLEETIAFFKSSMPDDIKAFKENMKILGFKRIPIKNLVDDMNGENMGILSKALATIKTDIVMPELKELIFAPNNSKKEKIYRRLEFYSLLAE